ncbi:MAG: DNA-protecting protein DprA [Anaerolineaceae bacterium]|nr:DNA-protecting protein DprA [Anaerolineaceae bacterium]
MSDHKYWLGFSLVPEIGAKRLSLLYSWFGELDQAWLATEAQLHEAGLEHQPIANILNARSTIDLDAEMAKVEKTGAWLVTLADEAYPAQLKKLPDAPPVLYVKGTLIPDDERALGIVGTRKATAYGRDVAHHFAKSLAGNQVTVVSGLAQGIDVAAHRGALDGGGRTFAVLGTGIDRIYPHEHLKMAQEISHHGAIISEFPIGTPPEARNFPRRNRIISGLSLGVLIVEAPEKSGAMITATMAAEQGRDVFAVPGNIFSAANRGTNRLIQDGAKLVMDVADILDEFNIVHRNVQTSVVTEQIAPANDNEIKVLDYLNADPIHIDDLVRMSGLSVAIVSSTLTILELKGLARSVGYMQYCLISKLF